jgi:hypothetical protein
MEQYRVYARDDLRFVDGGVVRGYTVEQANTLLHNSFRQD